MHQHRLEHNSRPTETRVDHRVRHEINATVGVQRLQEAMDGARHRRAGIMENINQNGPRTHLQQNTECLSHFYAALTLLSFKFLDPLYPKRVAVPLCTIGTDFRHQRHRQIRSDMLRLSVAYAVAGQGAEAARVIDYSR
jgi:hypothetical protein